MPRKHIPLTKTQIANASRLPIATVRAEAELWGLQDTASMTKADMVEYIQESAIMAEAGDY